MSKVTWHRQALGQLQLPGVCAATGQPATTSVRFVFQSPWARYVPGIAGLVLRLTNPPVRMSIPLSAEPAARVKKMRYLTFGGLGLMLIGLILLFALQSLGGGAAGLLFFLFLVAGVVVAIVGGARVNSVIGGGVDGKWIYMNRAHPAFIDAFVRMNPPGTVQVPDGVPQPQGYPQQAQPQPQQVAGYQQPQPAYVQQPPQGYQQPQAYPQPQGYPQQRPHPGQQPYPGQQQGYGQRPQGY